MTIAHAHADLTDSTTVVAASAKSFYQLQSRKKLLAQTVEVTDSTIH